MGSCGTYLGDARKLVPTECKILPMEKEKLFIPLKSEVFAMTIADMMGDPGDMEHGEVMVCAGVDGETRVFANFAATETFLVALRRWSDGCSTEAGEDWLRNWPQEEPEADEELPRFPLAISEDLVVTEADGGYSFADRDGVEYNYEELVLIMKEVREYFGN